MYELSSTPREDQTPSKKPLGWKKACSSILTQSVSSIKLVDALEPHAYSATRSQAWIQGGGGGANAPFPIMILCKIDSDPP
jgi:hypothetical protein